MFGYGEINRPVQVGDIGAAYTVGRIRPFAFYILVYIEMFQPDDFITGNRRVAVGLSVAVLP